MVPVNQSVPQLDGGNPTEISVIRSLKHVISSPKFYELLINIELKGDTALDLKNSTTTSLCV